MIVKCINDKFDFSKSDAKFIKNMILVGDLELYLPKNGCEYEVIGSWFSENEIKGYLLKEFDCSIYGGNLYFSKERFEIIDDSFIPNDIHPTFGLCRTESLLFKG